MALYLQQKKKNPNFTDDGKLKKTMVIHCYVHKFKFNVTITTPLFNGKLILNK